MFFFFCTLDLIKVTLLVPLHHYFTDRYNAMIGVRKHLNRVMGSVAVFQFLKYTSKTLMLFSSRWCDSTTFVANSSLSLAV